MGIGEQKDYVTISKQEYNELLEDRKFLNCLQNNGVDNWEWYGEACKMFHGEEE